MGYCNVIQQTQKRCVLQILTRSLSVQVGTKRDVIKVNDKFYTKDDFTNVTPRMLSYLNRNLHLQQMHPLSLIRDRIADYFYKCNVNGRGNPVYSIFDKLSPVVSIQQNFDDLLIPLGHPSRAKSDCFYINRSTLLRAHTTAHQGELIRSGLDNFVIIGDVYRRDEIDSTHFPVFHQVDGVRAQTRDEIFSEHDNLDIFSEHDNLDIFEEGYKPETYKPRDYVPSSECETVCLDESKQPCHAIEAVKIVEHQLKETIIGVVKHLFGKDIPYRWVSAYFPFTQPSWELEIHFKGDWMEVCGCGVMKNEILVNCGSLNTIGFAFGLGLERIAMALYDIPDIRLFWSQDSGFLNQFNVKDPSKPIKYKPVSLYPQCINDLSFWLPHGETLETFSCNDFYDLVRDIGGDVIEQVQVVDKFIHPKTGKSSLCFKIIFRHMERTLTKEEVNIVHGKIALACVDLLKVTIR